jgi:drug/metabolite transporter (DMT)-like permease
MIAPIIRRRILKMQIERARNVSGRMLAELLRAPADPASVAGHPFRGLVLFVSALLLFACMDTTTKFLSTDYNVPLVVAIRYIAHCVLMIALLAPSQGKRLVQTQRTGLVLVRAASLAIASLFVGLALRRMPVAETTAINFLAPMLVVLLAGPVLGERIGALGWTAAVLGFAGVLLIARPGSGLDATGILFALCAVGAGAAYQLLSRVLVNTERTVTLLFYTALIGSVGFGIFLPWFWEGETPTPWQVLLFLSMGVTGGLGHFLFTAAYRHAPASLLAPMNYLQLLWAGLLGWMVFGHMPDHLSLLGMCVVAASGAIVALKSRPPRFRFSPDIFAKTFSAIRAVSNGYLSLEKRP